MKALAYHGKGDMRCDAVPDPKIEHPRDAIIKVTACAICGSDLHIFDGVIPGMERGDILGHESMGEVVEVGRENQALKVGDRVVVPFTISCGECFFCKRGFFSGCERTNPDPCTARTAALAPHTAQHVTHRHIPAVEARQRRHGIRSLPAAFGRQAVHCQAEAGQFMQRACEDRGPLSPGRCVCGGHRGNI